MSAAVMSAKRKHDAIASATRSVFEEDAGQPSFLGNLNGDDAGDSSDPDDSDIEDDSEEEDEGNDSGEADSLDEEGEDEEEEDEDEEGVESASDDEEEEDDFFADEEEDDDDETSNKNKSKKEIKGKTAAEVKADRDSGIDDLPQTKTKVTKVKNKTTNDKRKQTSTKGKDTSSTDKDQSSTTTPSPSIAAPPSIALAPSSSSVPDEYAEDSSDEEDLRNTIGNVPIKWYDEYPHIGYDLDGKQIVKPKRGDTLDNFLNKMENPDFNRTVLDKQTGQDVRLSDADLDIVNRIMTHKVPDGSYDMYAPWVDHFTHEVMEMPLSGRHESKKSFIPSKSEAAYVARRAEQIRRGLIQYTHKKEEKYRFYDLWANADRLRGIHNHMAAPRLKLPGHGLSYNPPQEYLPINRSRYKSIRTVPGYQFFIKERFERCLDLYIAPRKRVMRVKAESKDLIPVLPKPQDLRPFPTMMGLIFKGHRSIIRSISVHPLGKYLASGSDDHTVKIWEISTGRCLRSFDIEAAVKWVAWNPSSKLFLLAVVIENKVIFLNPETYLTDKLVVQQTNAVFREEPEQGDYVQPERVRTAVTWRKPTPDEWAKGYRIVLEHFRMVKQIVWHKQGDYFATMIPEGDHRSVMMHQLSRWRSQVPFNKCKGRVQCIEFHPKFPFLYVATQTHIRVYNLQKQRMLKKVQANSRWVSSIAVHPGGEHFLIGGYDRKLNWFEMECTRTPHVLRFHKAAVRGVAFHRKYPLFASVSDEGRIIVSHGMVYNDWLKDPFLVPLKELRGHSHFEDLCVLDVAWHPYEPFLFTSGADATIRLWH